MKMIQHFPNTYKNQLSSVSNSSKWQLPILASNTVNTDSKTPWQLLRQNMKLTPPTMENITIKIKQRMKKLMKSYDIFSTILIKGPISAWNQISSITLQTKQEMETAYKYSNLKSKFYIKLATSLYNYSSLVRSA